jgi:hypothetical protein
MGPLRKLFGPKRPPTSDPLAAEFDAEWPRAVRRFQAVTGLAEIKITLRHPQTQAAMVPHEGLNATFAEWKEADAPYNRRRILADLLAQMVGGSMNSWQTANYYTADSRPNEALSTLEGAEPPVPGAADFAPHCAAYARALLGLTRYPEALEWARKAAGAAPDDSRIGVVLADALHLTEASDAAHEIYDGLMAQAQGSEKSGTEVVDEMFQRLFARDAGIVSSPVLALEIAEQLGDSVQRERFWELAETEFFYSPYFRMHHAYYLARIVETNRSFAKLIGLVQEMPWVKEASLNLERYFEQLDPSGKIMPEFQEELRHRIRENGWTREGMREISLSND